MDNYYKILGVNRDSSTDEIKKAFRALAKKYHPDNDSGDKKKFEEINMAYQILSDEQKRKAYDDKLDAASNRTNSQFEQNTSHTKKTASPKGEKTDPYRNVEEQFASFFGFRPGEKPGQYGSNEEKPLDTSAMFSSFFKPNKGKKF